MQTTQYENKNISEPSDRKQNNDRIVFNTKTRLKDKDQAERLKRNLLRQEAFPTF
jgi:hypothetical protein